MNCPKCKIATLQSVVAYSSEAPRKCDSCGGFWVPIEQIPKIIQQQEELETLLTPVEAPDGHDARAALCPNGHGVLSRARVEVEEGFFLDRCVHCGGIWFDQGEWQKIASAHLLSDIANFWTLPWQKKQREAVQEKAYLQWAKETFGAELLTQLSTVATALQGHPQRIAALTLVRNLSEK
jgi:Zn-finger nucleic acid-binding protein